MIKTTTKHDVIRHIYNETSEQENNQFKIDCIIHQDLAEEFHQFVMLKKQLDELSLTPSEHITRNILNYSKTCMLPC